MTSRFIVIILEIQAEKNTHQLKGSQRSPSLSNSKKSTILAKKPLQPSSSQVKTGANNKDEQPLKGTQNKQTLVPSVKGKKKADYLVNMQHKLPRLAGQSKPSTEKSNRKQPNRALINVCKAISLVNPFIASPKGKPKFARQKHLIESAQKYTFIVSLFS